MSERVHRLNLASLLAADTPMFVRCDCGTLSTRVPCFECSQLAERAALEREADDARGIPQRYRWAKLDAPELVTRAHVVPCRWYDDATSCASRLVSSSMIAALLLGPAGSGKTSLAVAASRAVRGAFFVKAEALERARIEHRAGDADSPLVLRAKRAPLLILDDLGQDKPSSISAVEAVILARHDAELRTWVTTGLDAASPVGTYPALESRYGAGVVRRLTERGVARVIRFQLGGGRDAPA